MSAPVAYFITFSTYGTWLHGRETGSVDLKNNTPGLPFLPPDPEVEKQFRARMRQEPYLLDESRRRVVLQTIIEVATHRKWKLWAVHVRTNHVHVVLTADCHPEKVMVDFKAWASRRLKEKFNENANQDRWTEHGSTRWLNSEDFLEEKVNYVLHEQGEPMEWHDGRLNEHEA